MFSREQAGQLLSISRKGQVSQEQAEAWVGGHRNRAPWLFNAALLARRVDLLPVMLELGAMSVLRDELILGDDPVSYSMEQNLEDISHMLIEYSARKGIFTELYYRSGGTAMRFLLRSLFKEQPNTMLPSYGHVQKDLLGVTSDSPHSYRLPDMVGKINLDSHLVSKIRIFAPQRPFVINKGSRDLDALLQSLDENMHEEVMASPAALLVELLLQRHAWFFYLESILRIAILGFIIASAYIQAIWAYIVALAVVVPIVLYELLSMTGKCEGPLEFCLMVAQHLFSVENLLDLTTILTTFLNSIWGLASRSGQNVLVAHLMVLTLCIRLVFALRVVRSIRKFLQIVVNIVVGIIPFGVIFIAFLMLAVLDGLLVPTTAGYSFRNELQDTLNGIINSQVENLDLFTETDQVIRATKYIIIYGRQVLLNIFFLNGILVGLVAGIYAEGERQEDLISFHKLTSSLREIETVYRNLYEYLGIRFHN
jgi:hypothetical protein